MASKYESFFRDELDALARQNLYRELKNVEVLGSRARVNGREVILLCSNDYLGLSRNRQVVSSTISALRRGLSQCSSRLVSGNDPALEELESKLARQKNVESVLVYPTGYMANLGAISGIAGRNDLVVSDGLNHASIVDACRMSRAETRVFRHNDADDLESRLAGSKFRQKVVVTEGVFSMDGDLAALDKIGRTARRNDALLVVDDAHGDFVYGSHYRGTAEHLGAEQYTDLLVSSMSKALGCFGGYVAGRGEITEYMINRSRPFIYTSALPSAFAAGAITALKLARKGSLQKKLWKNVQKLRDGLIDLGFDIRSTSHIIPITVKDEKLALRFSRMLLENGVFVQAIRYPTVPRGSARLRLSVTSLLTEDDIDESLEVFRRTAAKLRLV